MGGGAWPFLVGGVICLVNSDNERDLNLLNSYSDPSTKRAKRSGLYFGGFVDVDLWSDRKIYFLEGLLVSSQWKFEAITGL